MPRMSDSKFLSHIYWAQRTVDLVAVVAFFQQKEEEKKEKEGGGG